MLFFTFALYFVVCSAVFSYGIGMNFLLLPQDCIDKRLFKLALKTAIASFLSTAILWFPFSKPQFSAALSGFLPLLVALVSFALNKALSVLLPDDFTDSRFAFQEALFVFAPVFLSLKEGLSFTDALVISISCSASFAFFLFLMIAALSRLSLLRIPGSRLALPLAMVLLGIFSFIQLLFDIILSMHAFSG